MTAAYPPPDATREQVEALPWPHAIYPSVPREGSYPSRIFAAWIAECEERADRVSVALGWAHP